MTEQKSFYDIREKPSTWEEFGELVNHFQRDRLLTQQLICIAFTAAPQVSVRAIMELLRIPVGEGDSDFRVLSLTEIDQQLALFQSNAITEDYAKDDENGIS